jgi:hypothetical protein
VKTFSINIFHTCIYTPGSWRAGSPGLAAAQENPEDEFLKWIDLDKKTTIDPDVERGVILG